MTSELQPSEFIEEFVCGGPKKYAYKIVNIMKDERKTICKVRDITLNYNASQLVNFDVIRDMILKEGPVATVHTAKKIKLKKGRRRMKLMKSNYHALHVLKTARPKLRNAIVSNCDKQLVNSICECVPNVLNGDVKLSGCDKRKLRKHKASYARSPTSEFPSPAIRSLQCNEAGLCCLY